MIYIYIYVTFFLRVVLVGCYGNMTLIHLNCQELLKLLEFMSCWCINMISDVEVIEFEVGILQLKLQIRFEERCGQVCRSNDRYVRSPMKQRWQKL